MRIPAIRAKIGIWDYYVTTLTFEQVRDFVSKIDNNLHQSEGLKDLIQRSITNNFLSIKDYIVGQPEMFFNSLVLAVYDDYPDWKEIEFKYNDIETYQMGLLEFPGNHKVFPVDGQHRVEGIKAALLENPELKNQKIAAIFIGHSNTDEGKQKTRRLFSTLNRYAKPVSKDDIIALDEDDIVAILTRKLLEEYPVFTGKRVINAKQKAIPSTNKTAITSIITFYQANLEVLKIFLKKKKGIKPTKTNIDTYLKFRPEKIQIEEFEIFLCNFWNSFKTKINVISDYILIDENENPATNYRNNENGGNLIFRPVGFLPLVKVALDIYSTEDISFDDIFDRFNQINLNLDSAPWHYVIWNPVNKSMIMNSDAVTFLMLKYLFNNEIMSPQDINKLKTGYASKISFEGNISDILNDI